MHDPCDRVREPTNTGTRKTEEKKPKPLPPTKVPVEQREIEIPVEGPSEVPTIMAMKQGDLSILLALAAPALSIIMNKRKTGVITTPPLHHRAQSIAKAVKALPPQIGKAFRGPTISIDKISRNSHFIVHGIPVITENDHKNLKAIIQQVAISSGVSPTSARFLKTF